MMRPFALYSLLFASLLGVAAPARAQDASQPTLHVEDAGNFEDLSVNFDESFNAIENPYLSDSMRLNYQINLLQKMAQRQAELLKISDSFKVLGIPFNEPAPSRGLCAQMPPNAPCMKHYPDIYEPLVSARKNYYREMQERQAAAAGIVIQNANDPAAIEAARKAREEAERKLAEARAKAARLERETRYQWNDISCIAGNCTGVIIGSTMPGYRATVHKGTRLGDGTLVTDVHARGVSVIIDGDRIDLRPAPSGEAGSTAGATGSIARMIPASVTPGVQPVIPGSGARTATAPRASASAPASATATAPSGSVTATDVTTQAPAADQSGQAAQAVGGDTGSTSTVEPALGPSGLF